MRKSQRGVTLIGWIFLLTPLALVVYIAILMVPIYKNYMAVASSLKKVSTEGGGGAPNPAAIRNTLDKMFDTNYIDYPTAADIQITRSTDGGWVAIADYDQSVSLFGNLKLVAHFHKEEPL